MEEQLSVIFEGNDLSLLDGGDLYNHNFYNLPIRDIKTHKIARESLSIITSSEYTYKDVTVWIDICKGTRELTERSLQQLKAMLQAQNGILKVKQAGEWYQYTATMNELNVEFDGHNAYVQIGFLASTPIGRSVETFSLFNMVGTTTPSRAQTFFVDGSYVAQPIINITINSVTGSGNMSISNARTGQGITFSENLVAGDIIEIDTAGKSITRNGSEIDFMGMFPEFPSGTQQVQYNDTFTSRTVDVTAQYNKRVV